MLWPDFLQAPSMYCSCLFQRPRKRVLTRFEKENQAAHTLKIKAWL